MSVSFKPWKQEHGNPTQTLAMPLKANVPEPNNQSWELVTCPRCGRECWKSPLPEGITEDMFKGRLCTQCCLEEAVTVRQE